MANPRATQSPLTGSPVQWKSTRQTGETGGILRHRPRPNPNPAPNPRGPAKPGFEFPKLEFPIPVTLEPDVEPLVPDETKPDAPPLHIPPVVLADEVALPVVVPVVPVNPIDGWMKVVAELWLCAICWEIAD